MIKTTTYILNFINILLLLFIISIIFINNKQRDFDNEFISKYINGIEKLRNIKFQNGETQFISQEKIIEINLDSNNIEIDLDSNNINNEVYNENIEWKYHENDIFKEKQLIKNSNNKYIALNRVPIDEGLTETTIPSNSIVLISEKTYGDYYKIKIYNEVYFINMKYIL